MSSRQENSAHVRQLKWQLFKLGRTTDEGIGVAGRGRGCAEAGWAHGVNAALHLEPKHAGPGNRDCGSHIHCPGVLGSVAVIYIKVIKSKN